MSIRVHELAKHCGLTNKQMLEKLQEMRYPVKSHSSTVDKITAESIEKEYGYVPPTPAAPVPAPEPKPVEVTPSPVAAPAPAAPTAKPPPPAVPKSFLEELARDRQRVGPDLG